MATSVKGDEGLLEKLRRKLENKNLVESSHKEDTAKIIDLLKKENEAHLWQEWFALKISIEYPELIETAISKGDQEWFTGLSPIHPLSASLERITPN